MSLCTTYQLILMDGLTQFIQVVDFVSPKHIAPEDIQTRTVIRKCKTFSSTERSEVRWI